ncbi:lytic transglycosylase domain-containing protein [Sphingomonas sp. NBWT7]|uniref:lytic transglycosylase domain-containing protein n=1 Tax=Sphingomonas sp. NBWT7 TaxID=2596913 RepID=UPI00162AE12B|nr:lytic transglycosylase domain-containing protein [Sphingomonas sp. NBWT7]QNE33282.1 lytic transglycosylase domain-containing protein [Sphingomonas sp. NBWT7]
MVTGLKSGAIIGMALGLGGALFVAQDQDEAARTRAANLLGQQTVSAQPTTSYTDNGAIAAAIAQWRALQQTDSLPFDSYAGFLMAHPGWPNEAANRRAAEKQAGTGYATPGSVVAYFRRFPPQTAGGGVAYARALQASGAPAEAYEAARTAWRRGALSPGDEAALLTSFAGALRPEDHDARMDALLWQGSTGLAARQIVLTSPARRSLFEARLAFRTDAQSASALAAANDAIGGSDAGYVADKAVWLRNSGASPSARGWLARARASGMTKPGNVEEFYEVLLTNARGAAADNQHQTAYDIARQADDAYPAGTDVSKKPYGERDDYTSLVWLAGQTALNKLGRPADAMTMFDRYGRGSQSPQTRAKGFYWAGRAAEAAGRSADRDAFFNRAAGYRDQFYGQLAIEHLRRPLVAPPPLAPRTIDPATRQAFFARETVRAAQFLGAIGQYQDQSAFVKVIAGSVSSDADHFLSDELSRTIRRPDLAVMVGRAAMQNGLTDYSAIAFPTVAVPSGYDNQWTMIHAIARQESQFDRAAISSAGARGLMQLMPGTAREQAGKIGLPYDTGRLISDTSYNAQLGSSYFRRVFDSYGSYPLAVAAYNAGPGNVNKWLRANGDPRTGGVDMVDWIEAIPFTETRNYVQRVLENAVVYDLMNPSRARSRGPANLSWYLGRNRTG